MIPVDVDSYPSYSEIIPHPMDLGTIKKKLQSFVDVMSFVLTDLKEKLL